MLKTGLYGTEGIFGAGNALLRYETELVAGPGSKMRLNAGPRIEDAAIVEVFPVAAMDLLA